MGDTADRERIQQSERATRRNLASNFRASDSDFQLSILERIDLDLGETYPYLFIYPAFVRLSPSLSRHPLPGTAV